MVSETIELRLWLSWIIFLVWLVLVNLWSGKSVKHERGKMPSIRDWNGNGERLQEYANIPAAIDWQKSTHTIPEVGLLRFYVTWDSGKLYAIVTMCMFTTIQKKPESWGLFVQLDYGIHPENQKIKKPGQEWKNLTGQPYSFYLKHGNPYRENLSMSFLIFSILLIVSQSVLGNL